jgi:nucleotide sugar dehydrogenase
MNVPIAEIPQRLKEGGIKIAVFGLGRIGLPTAALFAAKGITVYGVDTQESVIQAIKTGNLHIDEPDLNDLLSKILNNGKLVVTTDAKFAMEESDVAIICVPTPITTAKVPDYATIVDLCKNALCFIKRDDLIIIESTISPGTIEDIIVPIIKKTTGLLAGSDYGIASCPERANPGKVLSNIRKVPRIIGGFTSKSTKLASAIYEYIIGADIIQVSNHRIACAVKLTENIFRDVNIALFNELAILYEKLGLDIIEIIKAASSKWNFQPHYPGAGVGGPCLPANPYYLIQEAIKVGFVPHLIRMAREINDRMPQHLVELVLEALNQVGKSVNAAKIAILGMAYKPDIHDFQLSPAIPIIYRLIELKAKVTIYDPLIQTGDKSEFRFSQEVSYADSLINAVKDCDCLIFVTAHEEFTRLKIKNLKKITATPLIVVDGRNIFQLDDIPDEVIYFGVGRRVLT